MAGNLRINVGMEERGEEAILRRWRSAGICIFALKRLASPSLLGLVLAAACAAAWAGPSAAKEGKPPSITGPLRVSRNPNYFEDTSGAPLILCGSQTWNTLQDWGSNGSLRELDFDVFVNFLKAHGHNFTLLWRTELPKFRGLPTLEKAPPDFTVSPHPWRRTGPGLATDGGLKFDLTKFDREYFNRLRARVQALDRAGIYAGVYLFTGEWLLRFRCPTDGYPFSGPNNVNGVDDGYRGGSDLTALASVTMSAPNAITGFQDAYVRKAVDTLNDLPNVLWIVSEEAPVNSAWWNDHLISVIRTYEKTQPFQHPIGYAALDSGRDSILYNSDADWVAPAAWVSPTRSCGTGSPSCKVNVNDSDHTYFGMWNDTPRKNRNYAWENFTRGNQVLFMDPYLVYYPRQGRNLCVSPVDGIGSGPDRRWENFRNNLGYLLNYSRKLNLANVTPNSALCSTGYCLAQTPPAGAEYLAYAPSGGSFTVDISAMPPSRRLAVEWFNPATGMTLSRSPIPAGAASREFTPPFNGDAVLYLADTAGHK
jgi:Putative collagen-binding domain of a collagenase